jgi:hypothetical protein
MAKYLPFGTLIEIFVSAECDLVRLTVPEISVKVTAFLSKYTE